MICGNCGLSNPDESQLCAKCSQPLVAASHITERKQASRKKALLIRVLFALPIVLIVLAIAIPNLVHYPIGDGWSPPGLVRTLAVGEATYATAEPAHGYVCLQELGSAGLIDSVLASGTKGGYRIVITGCEGKLPHKTYTIMVYPLQPSKGQHTYCAEPPAGGDALRERFIHIADPGASLETCLQSRIMRDSDWR